LEKTITKKKVNFLKLETNSAMLAWKTYF